MVSKDKMPEEIWNMDAHAPWHYPKEKEMVEANATTTQYSQLSAEDGIKARNDAIPHRLDFGLFGFLQFQQGPPTEVGVNGLFLQDQVLPALIRHLQNLHDVLPSRESGLAIQKLEECWLWLCERSRRRRLQGVEGTYHRHNDK